MLGQPLRFRTAFPHPRKGGVVRVSMYCRLYRGVLSYVVVVVLVVVVVVLLGPVAIDAPVAIPRWVVNVVNDTIYESHVMF